MSNNTSLPKTAARLMAVQHLYSYEMIGSNTDNAENMMEFYSHSIKVKKVDKKFFRQISEGAVQNCAEIDAIIVKFLDKNRTIENLGALLKAILRVAVYELDACRKTPQKVVISEYVNITREFFDESETGFINAVLDKIAEYLHKSTGTA